MSYERTSEADLAALPLPASYATYRLPDIRFAHHPADAAAVTPVVVVLLDRPAARNAFTPAMARSLVTAFHLLSRDARVRCVVLAGADPRHRTFCAGADLDVGFPTGRDTRASHRDSGGAVALAIFRCAKPVVAALNGSGVGVGITMALPADVRVASRDARYGFVFARRGLVMEACSSFFLPRLAGLATAQYLTTTGAVLPPTHRMLAPLFAEIVPAADVLPTALGLAADLAAHTSPVSTRLMKDMLYAGPPSPEAAHLLESAVLFQRFHSADLAEGIASFKDKRPPRFTDTLAADGPAEWPWWDTGVLARANAAADRAVRADERIQAAKAKL